MPGALPGPVESNHRRAVNRVKLFYDTSWAWWVITENAFCASQAESYAPARRFYADYTKLAKVRWHSTCLTSISAQYINNIYSARVLMHFPLLTDAGPRICSCGFFRNTSSHAKRASSTVFLASADVASFLSASTNHCGYTGTDHRFRRFNDTNLSESFDQAYFPFKDCTIVLTRSTEGLSAPSARFF